MTHAIKVTPIQPTNMRQSVKLAPIKKANKRSVGMEIAIAKLLPYGTCHAPSGLDSKGTL